MKDFIKRHKLIFKLLLFIQHLSYTIYFGFFMNLFRIAKIKKNKIVISNYFGKGYGDNAKYICDILLEKQKNKNDLDIVWLVNNINDKSIPSEFRKVKYNSIKGLYELSTAKIWLDNCRKSYHIVKRQNQFYIQLWHGCMMLKKIEFDVEKQLGKYYTRNMIHDNEMIDLFISNSEYFSNRLIHSFKYTGNILKCGEPKDDVLLTKHKEINNNFRKKYQYREKKIILYAPTFRMNYDNNPYDIDFERLYNSLEGKENYVIFIRLHPNVKDKRIKIIYNDHIIDMSLYPDMQELLAAADILITDYSSIMFESMMIDKRVILYASDIDSYEDDRGFYFNLKELPFPLVSNSSELIEELKNNNFDKNKYSKLKKEIGLYKDFNSSETVANIILEKIKEDK